jgi:hypothetical protein
VTRARATALAVFGAFVASAWACGGGGGPAPATARAAHDGAGARADGGAESGAGARDGLARPRIATLDELAALGPREAPLMREVGRRELGAGAPGGPAAAAHADAGPDAGAAAAGSVLELRADADLCVRAFVASSAPVRAWLADDEGGRRGDGAGPAMAGASLSVPPGGPACVKRGERVRLVVDGAGAGAIVRALLFAAP